MKTRYYKNFRIQKFKKILFYISAKKYLELFILYLIYSQNPVFLISHLKVRPCNRVQLIKLTLQYTYTL